MRQVGSSRVNLLIENRRKVFKSRLGNSLLKSSVFIFEKTKWHDIWRRVILVPQFHIPSGLPLTQTKAHSNWQTPSCQPMLDWDQHQPLQAPGPSSLVGLSHSLYGGCFCTICTILTRSTRECVARWLRDSSVRIKLFAFVSVLRVVVFLHVCAFMYTGTIECHWLVLSFKVFFPSIYFGVIFMIFSQIFSLTFREMPGKIKFSRKKDSSNGFVLLLKTYRSICLILIIHTCVSPT